MAGGTFLSQNKIRPGAYINFEAVPKSALTVGDRGIATIALPLDWGAEGELIEVLSSDMLDGNSKKKVGFTAFDGASKLLSAMLNYCYKALVYRTTAGGAKAHTTIGGLTATAKYTGTFGNKINIAVISLTDGSGLYEVVTYVDGAMADKQKVKTIDELEPNDYVVFSGSGSFEATSGTALESGTSGTATDSTAYTNYFKLLKMARWQTLACVSSDSSIQNNAISFIKQMRDDSGRYVQGVVCNNDSADYEGIINSVSGVVIDGVTFEPNEFVSVVAGMTAGANINESNTSKVVAGADRITNELNNEEIIKALEKGQFVISTSSSGKIKVEKDINSLHTFTADRNYTFSKNRVIRTLDEIGTSISITWEDRYSGKVNNDNMGRNLFKSDISVYCNELQRLSAIQEFDAKDIEVLAGKDIDSVEVNLGVKPVDSMEKLYMVVRVR